MYMEIRKPNAPLHFMDIGVKGVKPSLTSELWNRERTKSSE